MSSTFDSFNGSALGARVQSRVDSQAFGEPVTSTTVLAQVSVMGVSTEIWDTTRAADGDSAAGPWLMNTNSQLGEIYFPSLSPRNVRRHGVMFSAPASAPLLGAGNWVTAFDGTDNSPELSITGVTSGLTLTIPSHVLGPQTLSPAPNEGNYGEVGTAYAVGSAVRTQTIYNRFSGCAVLLSYSVPDHWRVQVAGETGDVLSLSFWVKRDAGCTPTAGPGGVAAESIPADIDFVDGEDVEITF